MDVGMIMTGIDEKAKEYVGGSDYADSVFGKSERHAYVSGAEYVLDQACKWLEENLIEEYYHCDDNEYPYIESGSFITMQEFINQFKKAMEG